MGRPGDPYTYITYRRPILYGSTRLVAAYRQAAGRPAASGGSDAGRLYMAQSSSGCWLYMAQNATFGRCTQSSSACTVAAHSAMWGTCAQSGLVRTRARLVRTRARTCAYGHARVGCTHASVARTRGLARHGPCGRGRRQSIAGRRAYTTSLTQVVKLRRHHTRAGLHKSRLTQVHPRSLPHLDPEPVQAVLELPAVTCVT
jgi:hypothetical protein